MIKNLILDWSGTLVDDFGATLVATNAVFEAHGLKALNAEQFRRDFRLPYPEFYEEFLPGQPLEELEVLFKKAFAEAEHLVQPLEPTRAFLAAAQARSLRLFVFSSMNEEALLRQAKDFGLTECFEAIYAGVLDKRERLGEVLRTHGLEKSETAYVGDMVHDVHAAQEAGVTSVALLSGYDSGERLLTARPQVILPDVGELPSLCSSGNEQPVRKDIVVRQLQVPVFIGVPDEERAKSQDVKVNLVMETARGLRNLGDDLSQTIDYYAVTEAIKKLAGERPRKLIETLADEIADLALSHGAQAVRVEIEKAILINCEAVVVRIEKRR